MAQPRAGGLGIGTLFALAPNTATPTDLLNFTGNDGQEPGGGLIADGKGNLYGTTAYGGTTGSGIIFKIVPATGAFTVLHNFLRSDGAIPLAGLVLDAKGNLYGTTAYGGTKNFGTLFALNPTTSKLTVLHNFIGTDGKYPEAEVIFDSKGSLYGTTNESNATNTYGTVFKYVPSTGKLTTLHSFGGADGAYPAAPLVFDTKGNLYGTAALGGAKDDGTVFELVPTTLKYTLLHTFAGTDGSVPDAGLSFDSKGNLYGTTTKGGAKNDGTIFKLSP